MSKEINFSFPRSRFTNNPPYIQLQHIKSELEELDQAYMVEIDINRVAEEAMDLIHSVETLLRILEIRFDIDVDRIKTMVIGKNQARGYYND